MQGPRGVTSIRLPPPLSSRRLDASWTAALGPPEWCRQANYSMRATFSRRWRPILPKKSIDPGARCLRSRAFNETMMSRETPNVRGQIGDRLAYSNALATLQRQDGAGMGLLFPPIGQER